MKKFLSLTILFLASVYFADAQYLNGRYDDLLDSEHVSYLKKHVDYLSSQALEGRSAGSEFESDAADYLRDAFQEYGLDLITDNDAQYFGIKCENGDTLTSRNVIGVIQGYDKKLQDSYIVIGAHIDGKAPTTYSVNGETQTRINPGANDNASGMAMMLELARMLKTNSALLRRSVIFVGFGASMDEQVGSWYFLNRYFKNTSKIDAMINLDVLGRGLQGFYAYTSSNADLNSILDEMSKTLQPVRPELLSAEPFASDHRMFYSAGIPSILFTSGTFPEKGTDMDSASRIRFDYMEMELEYIYNYTVSLVNGDKPAFIPKESAQMDFANSEIIPYYMCDFRPSFLGSTDPKVFLEKWVYAYLKYPSDAVEKGIQGRVLVDFIIDEKGKVKDVKVLKGVDESLDAAAVKVVAASPDWKPGRSKGKKCKSEMSLYIDFKLTKNK